MPMTTISGGIKAVNSVIFCPIKTMVPKLQITPMATTAKLINIAEKDLKNKYNVTAHKNKEPNKNQSISFLILSAKMVLI